MIETVSIILGVVILICAKSVITDIKQMRKKIEHNLHD